MQSVVKLANQFLTLVNDLFSESPIHNVKDSQDLAYTLKKKLEHHLGKKLVVQFVGSTGWLIEIDKTDSADPVFSDVIECLNKFKPLKMTSSRDGELPEVQFIAKDMVGEKHTVQVSEMQDAVWVMVNY